jgi:hypothetical protein
MSETGVVKGFKVFNPDWTCNPNGKPFQYAVGGTYEEDVKPMVCDRGFHFCEKAADCFNYYQFNPENKVAEVLALGEVDTDGTKSCTNKIQIVREIPWAELLEIVNTGKGCTGLCNSGDWNSGDWNKCSFSNGCFNTVSPKIYLFNKPSEWTYQDWLNSEARYLLNQIPGDVLEYIYLSDMTDEEKAAHPEAETTGGYLKILDNSECAVIWWRGLSDRQKAVITAIPNFDKEIFKQITGIDVDAD